MNDSEVEACHAELLRLQAELEALDATGKEASQTVELDQTRVGRLSRMDAMQAQQMAIESDRRRQQQLAKIAGALRRLESGDYGYCFACEEEIDSRRLHADPTVTRCLTCADK